MHPIIVDHAAADLRTRRLAEAALHRHVRAARAPRAVTRTWRARQARRLLALARRLDPTVESRPAARPAAVR